MTKREKIADRFRQTDPIFSGARFDVYRVEIEGPDGRTAQREAVIHPGAVVILPLLTTDTVIFIRNRRFAVEKTLWELPAGTLEEKEEPQTTAERELCEETGYRAAKMQFMSKFYTTPGFCNETMYAFLATDLTLVGQNLDAGEQIEVVPTSFSTALDWIKNGTIQDGKTIAALLHFHSFLYKK